jgi:hypothetical protein
MISLSVRLPTRFGDSNQSLLNEGLADNSPAGVARIFEGASECLPRVDTLFLLATLEPLINSRRHIASHDGRIASHDYRLEARAKMGFV